ncbi:ABC transporter permease [Sciscionella marina]|uniref:ABC transporter permease n=1 Tax=Sciscionella marina TaxID=508770 RepID=UPI0003679380|nr:ABC transporter permease [Sciscionella marina]
MTTVAEHSLRARGTRTRRILGRAVSAVIVLWACATLIFFVQILMPGDRATLLLNQVSGEVRTRTAAELAPINRQYGFDQPILVQYLRYLGQLLHGDLGTSYQLARPTTEIILGQLWPTVSLMLAALLIAWVLALAVTLATAGRGRFRSATGSGIETIAAALPQYWLGILLLLVFSLALKWFPAEGDLGPRGLVLPALTLAIPIAGFLAQLMRDEFTRALSQPFVVTARTRGLRERQVRAGHVLRHSVLPAVSLSGWAVGALLSGAVIVETVYARPGIGQVLVQAAITRDIPLVSGIVLVIAATYIIANLLVDLAYVRIDPRITTS